MARLTDGSTKCECRCNKCYLEDWVYEQTGKYISCDGCQMMQYVNKLAEYEDKYEENEAEAPNNNYKTEEELTPYDRTLIYMDKKNTGIDGTDEYYYNNILYKNKTS